MINPNSYYTVQAWMVNDLGLHGNELALYAIIYGFSQDGRSAFTGSIAYIMEWLGCSKNTAIKSVAALVDKGLIIKKASTNGVDTNTYKARLDLINSSANSAPGVVQNLTEGSANSAPNNYLDNYLDNKEKSIEKKMETDAFPVPNAESEKKPVKHKYGEYQNVRLTDEEHTKLSQVFPDLPARIERLSEYIASTGRRYKSHYATIRSWAHRDHQQRPAARPFIRGQATGTVGPNGIAIDPNKNDLDGYM